MPTQLLLITIYLLLIFAYSSTHGFYSFPAFLLILIAYILLLFLKFDKNSKKISTNTIYLTLFTSISLSIVYYGGLYQVNNSLKVISYLILLFLIPGSLLYIFKIPKIPTIIRSRFLIFLTCAAILRIFMIISSPEPKIDVYNALKIGSRSLADFKNPYQLTFPKIYPNHIPVLYGYLPGSALAMLPFSLLLNEPRYIYVISDIASALILLKIIKITQKGKGSNKYEMLPVIFLFNPMSLYVIEQSYLEPLLTSLIFLFTYMYLKDKHKKWPYIVLGLALSIKQSIFLILPSLLLKLDWKIKNALIIFFTTFLIIAPFILWNPGAFFFNQTAGFNPIYNTAPQNASLNLSTFLFHTKGLQLNNLSRFSLIILISLFIFRRTHNGIQGFMYSYTLFVFTITLMYTQAFLNYFTFISPLVLLLLAFSHIPHKGKQ